MVSILLLNSTAIHTLGEMKQVIELHRLAWKEEIITLTETLIVSFNSLIENDKKQIEIDGQQQTEIKDLTDLLTKLGGIVIDNDTKQLKLTKEIMTVIEELQDIMFQTKSKLKGMKTIDLKNVENIKEANILISNTSTEMECSGSHIRIKDEDYILTCAHIIKSEEDFIWGVLDTENRHPLELIKFDRKKDLALFKIFMVEDLPHLEISNEAPKEGSEILLIGNPDYLEDVITGGVIAKVKKKGYLFTNLHFFGSSGGAVLYKGKIVGIVSKSYSYIRPPFIINLGYSPKLKTIKEFLKGDD